jgi:hypothetical protein
MAEKKTVSEKLQGVGIDKKNLSREDFTRTQGSSGSPTDIATFEAPEDMEIRPGKRLKIAIPVVETTTTNGTGSQTVSLSNDIIESPNTQDILIYSNEGSGDPDTVVEPSSVDYDANSFDYDDGGSAEDLEIYYIARNPGTVDIKKVAPQTEGSVEETLYGDASSLINTTNQQQEPIKLDLNQSRLQRVVPEDWDIVVTVDLPYDSSVADKVGNAQLQLPVGFLNQQVDGVDKACAKDIIDRNSA